EQLVAATRKALADCAGELTPEYAAQVESALKAAETALANEDAQTKIGNTKQLQADCAALDEATKPLAELLMDKVTEAMLKKRGLV
ncbi:MAG TPA: molecular chaperone DnaK, partial [Candidatus Polarisedimenticolia bacterium]|nr:molecular chaperone DnaK [Candidatus Polarisedimenticolia bacterium]